MLKILYCIYQVFVAIPVTILMTIWTAILVGVGCALGNGHFWGYYPGPHRLSVVCKRPTEVEQLPAFVPALRASLGRHAQRHRQADQ